MRCIYCGAENPKESLFCVNCGKSITNSKNEKKNRKVCVWAGIIAFVVLCCVIGGIIVEHNVNAYDAGYSVIKPGNGYESTLPVDPVQVTFNNISGEDILQNGISGCRFHLNFTINGAQNHRIKVGYTIKDDLEKTIYEGIYADAESVVYQSSTWNDYLFFLPYVDFKYNLSEGPHKLRACPFVYDIDTGMRYQLDSFFIEFNYYNEY